MPFVAFNTLPVYETMFFEDGGNLPDPNRPGWSNREPPPAIGTRIRIKGPRGDLVGTVTGYAIEAAWLWLLVTVPGVTKPYAISGIEWLGPAPRWFQVTGTYATARGHRQHWSGTIHANDGPDALSKAGDLLRADKRRRVAGKLDLAASPYPDEFATPR